MIKERFYWFKLQFEFQTRNATEAFAFVLLYPSEDLFSQHRFESEVLKKISLKLLLVADSP